MMGLAPRWPGGSGPSTDIAIAVGAPGTILFLVDIENAIHKVTKK
jgi:hypothetical protein